MSLSVKLSELGRSFVAELRHRYGTEAVPVPIKPTDFDVPRVLLLSLFDGIGGARRALERLRLMVCLYLSVELDRGAMRVVREAWAEVIELGDVRAVGRLVLGPLFSKGSEMGCQVVVSAGGFPCQDVSQLNRNRAGAEGTRSGLVREFIRVTRLAEELALAAGMLFIGLGECTKMDYTDKVKITSEVSWPCLELCSSGSSRVRRPRLYWHSPRVQARPGFLVYEEGAYSWGELAGPLEPTSA